MSDNVLVDYLFAPVPHIQKISPYNWGVFSSRTSARKGIGLIAVVSDFSRIKHKQPFRAAVAKEWFGDAKKPV